MITFTYYCCVNFLMVQSVKYMNECSSHVPTHLSLLGQINITATKGSDSYRVK